jgi:molybdopterin molybdotransferase
VHVPVTAGGAIRRAGSDLAQGAVVLDQGAVVTAPAVSLIAGAGVVALGVHRRPRVAVLATGDEVRDAGESLGEAGIPDANRPGLLAHVTAAGGEPIDLGIATDNLDDVVRRLRGAIGREADAIVVSGGVSVGPYDVVRNAFEAIGHIDLWRVAVQPGKPFAFGTAERRGGGAPVLLFGLPGNPVSTMVTFELFVRPALRRLAGDRRPVRAIDRAVLGDAVSTSTGRRAFIRVAAERRDDGSPRRDGQGRVLVRLAGGQGSHVLSALATADALAVIPENVDDSPAGAEVELWWLDRG